MTKTVYLSYEIPGEDRQFLENAILTLAAARKIKSRQEMEDAIIQIVNLAVASSLIKVHEEAAGDAN